MRILVTGGAGYVGSHVVRQLLESGFEVVVYDNLSTGHAWAVGEADLVVADLSDLETLNATFASYRFDAVMHFAALTSVPESVTLPLKYYRNNTVNTLNLLYAMEQHQVKRLIFSSTAAVYGMPDIDLISEDTPLNPINAYGQSKAMSEKMITDASHSNGLDYVILRYFNVAGARLDGSIGQASREATHLIKIACESVIGKRQGMKIFGNDYQTRDGTCIRDYIHVEDLAHAHIMALNYLIQGGQSNIFNCGYGEGYTVKEIIDVVKSISDHNFPVETAERRPGDPDILMANKDKIERVLGWQPLYNDITLIVETALQWENNLLNLSAANDAHISKFG